MAVTAEGAALTAAHGTAQLAILRRLFRYFESEFSVTTAFDAVAFTAWAHEVAPEVAAAYALSARTSARYYEAFRRAEGVPGEAPEVLIPDPSPERFVERLDRFGPAYARALVDQGVTDEAALKRALVQMGLSATQDVMSGGREAIGQRLAVDERALGWQRVARRGCCSFCAMLAARGPVYSSRGAAGGGRSWHRGCKCRPEPVFDRRSALPPESVAFAELWDRVEPGDFNEFRRAYERPHLHDSDEAETDEQPDA